MTRVDKLLADDTPNRILRQNREGTVETLSESFVLMREWPSALCRCKHNTAPRTLCHFAHVIFARVWLKIESQTQCGANCVPSEELFGHPRASCLTRTRHGLIFHLFHFLNASLFYFYYLAVTNNHKIHAEPGRFGRVATQSPLAGVVFLLLRSQQTE